jgi:hypothetical protein
MADLDYSPIVAEIENLLTITQDIKEQVEGLFQENKELRERIGRLELHNYRLQSGFVDMAKLA